MPAGPRLRAVETLFSAEALEGGGECRTEAWLKSGWRTSDDSSMRRLFRSKLRRRTAEMDENGRIQANLDRVFGELSPPLKEILKPGAVHETPAQPRP